MVVYTCQCLNVKVHSSTATEVADPNGFTRVLALGLAGVHLVLHQARGECGGI